MAVSGDGKDPVKRRGPKVRGPVSDTRRRRHGDMLYLAPGRISDSSNARVRVLAC